MPLNLSEDCATLTGVVTVEEAEPLAQWLRVTTGPKVRLADCTHLHTSALQALMAGCPSVITRPTDPFLARWIVPLLNACVSDRSTEHPPIPQESQ